MCYKRRIEYVMKDLISKNVGDKCILGCKKETSRRDMCSRLSYSLLPVEGTEKLNDLLEGLFKGSKCSYNITRLDDRVVVVVASDLSHPLDACNEEARVVDRYSGMSDFRCVGNYVGDLIALNCDACECVQDE